MNHPHCNQSFRQYYSQLGQNVRQRRLHQKLSRKELARRSNLSVHIITRLESGKGNIRLTDLICIAQALDILLSQLLPHHED